MKIQFLSLACLWAGAVVARAATLETITVTAQRTPVTIDAASIPVEVIDADAVTARQALTADALLRGLPGVSIASAGGIGALSELRLRGSEANHVLVMVDGVEVNDPATGSSVDFAHLDLAGVRRVEIASGPQSALWGSDAIGGVIYFDTTTAVGARVAEANASLGTHNTSIVNAQAAANDGRWHYALSGQRIATDGTNVARAGNEDDGYDNVSWSLNTGFSASDWSVQAVARGLTADVDYDPTPFPDFVPADGDDTQEIDHGLARIDLRLRTDSPWQHRITADYFDSSNTTLADGRRASGNDADRYRLGYQSSWTVQTGDLQQDVILGYEYERERFRQRGAASAFGDPNQNQHVDNQAIVGEWVGTLAGGMRLNVSARHDDNSAFRDATSYRIATRLPASRAGTVFANYGTGHKNPTFTERFGFTPDTFIGNPNLDPERSTGYSIAYEHVFNASTSARVTGFRDRLDDEIDGFVFDVTQGAFTARNDAARSHREGIELSTRTEIGALQVSADYTYLDATEQDAAGDVDELRRPRHTGRLILDLQVDRRVSIQLGGVYTGARDDLDFSSFPARRVTLHDYALLHLVARAQLSQQLSMFARIENLADADYEDVFGYATPGRTMYIGLTARL